MTPTISPVAGALPQQPAALPSATATSSCSNTPAPLAPASSVGVAPDTTATALAGGATQAAQGAAIVSPEQLIPVLQQLVAVVNQLVNVLQQQRTASVAGATGGGAAIGQVGQVGACGMSGCSMDHATEPKGANAAPTAAPVRTGKQRGGSGGRGAPGHGAPPQGAAREGAPASAPPANPGAAATVEPSSVRDKTSLSGLTGPSKRGLEEAHRFGLPLVSGKRSGGGSSDHDHGNAIDVADIPIGAASSTGGSPKMKSFAEHMRQEGKAGRLDVKYIIRDGQIASATNDWEWRDYVYPGKSTSSLAALKASNPGEYNRLQHYDHVHVSFG